MGIMTKEEIREEIRENTRLRNKVWREKDREAYNKHMREWKANNRDKVSKYKWKERYGITEEQYTEMYNSQNGKCAICGKEETATHNTSNKVLKLAVDHCHTTGKVRELLCQKCNRGIGKFDEDPDLFDKAKQYVLKHRGGII